MDKNEIQNLVKQCIIEIIEERLSMKETEFHDPATSEKSPGPRDRTEPVKKKADVLIKKPENVTIINKPKKINENIKKLVKECVEETLKENLLEHDQHGRYAQEAGAGPFDPRTFGVNKEGFDPTSMGPNPAATEGTQTNPYEEWNEKMARMEEVENPTHNKVPLEEKLKKLERMFSVLQTRQQNMSPDDQIELNQCVEEIAHVLKRYWHIIVSSPVNEDKEESYSDMMTRVNKQYHHKINDPEQKYSKYKRTYPKPDIQDPDDPAYDKTLPQSG
jgi:hypothetical protein